MANFTAGTSFSDGVTNDVTAAKLNALVADAVPTVNLSLNSTTGTIATFNSTTGTITGLRSTTGTVATLNSTTGTITGLNSTTGTVATLNSTTGTIATLNSTTGTIATLVATGTITGSTNVVNIGSGQIYKDASGNVGLGTSSPAYKLDVSGQIALQSSQPAIIYLKTNGTANNKTIKNNIDASGNMVWQALNDAGSGGGNTFSLIRSAEQINSIEAQSGGTSWFKIDNNSQNVGIGATTPDSKLSVYGTNTSDSGAIYTANILNTATAVAGVGSGLVFGTNIATSGTNNVAAMAGIEGIKENGTTTNYASALKFTTRAMGGGLTEKLRIDSSGNVSIGTATALSKLHVHGDLTMSNATTAITASTSTITPPATVAGYLTVSINGTSRKIAYYAT